MDLKKIMYALIAVVLMLAGALAYVWWDKTGLVNELNIEKEELTSQMIALQNDYATLSSDYDTINSQLDSSREEVSQLIERIKKTEATNRSKMRQYEKELGTLRSIMRNYIVQLVVRLQRSASSQRNSARLWRILQDVLLWVQSSRHVVSSSRLSMLPIR